MISAISTNSWSRMRLTTLVEREPAGLNAPGLESWGCCVTDGVVTGLSNGANGTVCVAAPAAASRSRPLSGVVLELGQ